MGLRYEPLRYPDEVVPGEVYVVRLPTRELRVTAETVKVFVRCAWFEGTTLRREDIPVTDLCHVIEVPE